MCESIRTVIGRRLERNSGGFQQMAGEDDFKRVERSVSEEVATAVKFADESPFPPPEELYIDVCL